MKPYLLRYLVLISGAIGFIGLVGAAGEDDWKLEVLYRKNGVPFKGLLVQESVNEVVFKCIYRKPGAPTLVFTENIEKSNVLKIEKLSDEERTLLATRLDALAKERERFANTLRSLDIKTAGNKTAIEYVKLESEPWPGPSAGNANTYTSQYFVLKTNAKPELARLAVIQLEQVFSAYSRTLPPRKKVIKPTTILLTNSLDEYQGILKSRKIDLKNPAYFDLEKNEVICGSDLERLSLEQEKITSHHLLQLQDLQKREADLKQIYKNKIPNDLASALLDNRKKIKLAEDSNLNKIKQERIKLFERLYHEAFHAFLFNCVFDPRETAFPLWLNEGLAQIFESAVFEIGELRIGHADKSRLDATKLALKQNTMPSIKDLLLAQPRLFLVSHLGENESSQKMYLASYALAFHLTFKQKILGKTILDDYALALKNGAEPIACFEKLTGHTLAEFEKQHLTFLNGLRLNGTSINPN